MRCRRRKILFLAFVLSAVCSFGDDFLDITSGPDVFAERFPVDYYSRYGTLTNSALAWRHYSEDRRLGFFVRAAYGKTNDTVIEENNREQMSARDYDAYDVRFSGGPSFRVNFSPEFFIPLSLGPVFSFYFENTREYLLKDSARTETSYWYTAVSGGISGNLALVLFPLENFFLTGGIMVNWLFFRAESLRMRMNYRTTNNAVLKPVRYSEADASVYLGLGVRFSLPGKQKTGDAPEPDGPP
jgi:hypothetical protein